MPTKPKKEIRICVICGNEFLAWISRRKQACSGKCEHQFKYKAKKETQIIKLKICIYCGKEFIAVHGNRKTCSSKCKHEYSKTTPSKLSEPKHFEKISCIYCGMAFVPKYSYQKFCCKKHAKLSNEQNRKEKYLFECKNCGNKYSTHRKECNQFCSRECSDLHRKKLAEQHKEERIENKKEICKYCNHQFMKHHSQQIYCSVECRHQSILNNLSQIRESTYKSNMCICKECGISFSTSYGNKHRSYCSDKCRNKRTKRINKSIRRTRIYGTKGYEKFDPIDVLIRDEWHCKSCGVETPKHLRGTIEDNAPELDHIIPISLGGIHTQSNTQCLCRKCNQNKGSTIDSKEIPPMPLKKSSNGERRAGGAFDKNFYFLMENSG